jgi:hypothetical protein
MIRKFALALAAVAAIGAAGFATSSDAVAAQAGYQTNAFHIGIGFGPGFRHHGWRHRHWGPRIGFGIYAPVYEHDCYKVRTKRGTRIVCRY